MVGLQTQIIALDRVLAILFFEVGKHPIILILLFESLGEIDLRQVGSPIMSLQYRLSRHNLPILIDCPTLVKSREHVCSDLELLIEDRFLLIVFVLVIAMADNSLLWPRYPMKLTLRYSFSFDGVVGVDGFGVLIAIARRHD